MTKPLYTEDGKGCWRFTGRLDRDGYGRISGDYAHRVAYVTWCGPIPDGMHVLHSCDVPCCINPAHLRVGTPADNANDRNSRGRTRTGRLTGEANPRAKLTAAQVRQMREWHEIGIASYAELARKFGIQKNRVADIVRRRSWKDTP